MADNSLLNRWKQRKKGVDNPNRITKAPSITNYPLSRSQQRLWFLQQLYPESSVYNYAEIYSFDGTLDSSALKASIQSIYKDNHILRTTYLLENGTPTQKVSDQLSLDISEYDFSMLDPEQLELEKQKIFDRDTNTPFNLSVETLVRVTLMKINTKKHILLVTMHHIITDKWSMGVFRKELSKKYNLAKSGGRIPDSTLEIQYTDYAYHQNKIGTDLNQLAYWKEKLGGEIPLLDLPVDYTPVSEQSFAGNSINQPLSLELSKQILELSKSLEVTPYVFFLSAFYVLLHKHSKQEDIIVGSPISNRNEPILQDMIGFFDETIVLRTAFKSIQSFKSLVMEVKKTTLEAFSNKDVPFDMLVKEINPKRALGQNPFFRSMFIYHAVPETPSFGPDLQLSHAFFDNHVSKFDLTLYVANENEHLTTAFEYATSLFSKATIHKLLEQFTILLEQVVKYPEKPIWDFDIITPSEKEIIIPKENQSNGPYYKYEAIHDIILENVKDRSNKLAVTFEDHSISYQKLEEHSKLIATKIVEITEGENKVIGLCSDRSIDMIVGILAILRAGCAYLPIDPEYPMERINFMMSDSNAGLLLVQENHKSINEAYIGTKLCIEEIYKSAKTIKNRILPKVKSTDLAYVIYTSGSSGKPKGVPITHANIIKSTEGRLEYYPDNPTVFLLLSSFAFDSSKAGIFWTLCTGGTLVITKNRIEQDITQIADQIQKNRVTHTLMLPTLYRLLLENVDASKLQSLTTIMVAGETCPTSVCDLHFKSLPNALLFNEYGPTEATVWCIAHQINKDDNYDRIPIGKAVSSAKIYILGNQMELLPIGVPGEIYVGGPGLSGSYINRPDLTELAYVPNPFTKSNGDRLYKTGDLGRYNGSGHIEFLGRADRQLKIRGHRVELNEIESLLNDFQFVREAAVSFREKNDRKQLVAFIEVEKGYIQEEFNNYIRTKLPIYMHPNSIVEVNEFPRLPNGKVDKKQLDQYALPEVKKKKSNTRELTKVEKILVEIWEATLKVEHILVTDNFFELGGDSILSIQIIARARDKGILFPANQIFESQTIEELSLFVQEATPKSNTHLESGTFSLTPIQKWFFDLHKIAPQFWNQGYKLSDFQDLNKSELQYISEKLVEQFDTLRLNFTLDNDEISANYDNDKKYFQYVDVTHIQERELEDFISNYLLEFQKNAVLETSPLFNCIYFKCSSKNANILVLIAHHLLVDVVSWNLILDFLDRQQKAIVEGIELPIEAKTISFKQWSDHLNESVEKIRRSEKTFWLNQLQHNTRIPVDYTSSSDVLYEKDIKIYDLDFNKHTTTQLLTAANQAYNTTIDELILVGLVDTIASWTDEEHVLLFLERHGRESIHTPIDFSNSVGWFTSFFPLNFRHQSKSSYSKKIMSIKEKSRKVPNGGIGYGVLKYIDNDSEFQTEPKVVFNFLGVVGNPEQSKIEFIQSGLRDEMSERNYLLEINSMVINGILKIRISYCARVHEQNTIVQFSNRLDNTMKQIVEHCLNATSITYTPSDFPDVDLDQNDLDTLLGTLE